MNPWKNEHDSLEFEAHGLPVKLLRHPHFGHWCGYIGVPESHPWFGKNYSDVVDGKMDEVMPAGKIGVITIMSRAMSEMPDGKERIDIMVPCHGGLTFADNPYWGGEYRAKWFFGFDCNHCDDMAPYSEYRFPDGVYREMEYVKASAIEAAEVLARYGGVAVQK